MEEKIDNKLLKIAILGAESTGKTTLCEQLANHYKTVSVPEYAREYFNSHSILDYSIDDLVTIARKQVEMEQIKEKAAKNFIFCDTTLITIKIWAEHQFKMVPDFISEQISKKDHDLFLICNNDIEWQSDEQRKHPHIREHVLERNINEVKKLNVPYHIISGEGTARLKLAINIVNSFLLEK